MVMGRVHVENRKFTVRPENGEVVAPPPQCCGFGLSTEVRYFPAAISPGATWDAHHVADAQERDSFLAGWRHITYPYVPDIVSVILV
jgi:hypothetical protein